VLFSESNSRFLIEVSEKTQNDFEAATKGKVRAEIGVVTRNPKLTVYGINGGIILDVSLTDLRRSWKETLSSGV
jgi:phosphoribosylformylglycinamidine synthase